MATNTKSSQEENDPFIKVPVPNELRPIPEEQGSPSYLPQKNDALLDWGPQLGPLTGTRPVVDKYSVSRFSNGEWRKRNKEMLDMSESKRNQATNMDRTARQILEQTRAQTDQNQTTSTKRLLQREKEIHRWRCELERAIEAISDEITLLEQERTRLKQSQSVIMMPESIASECLHRRTCRLDQELVRDEVESELIKEVALIAEAKQILTNTLRDIEIQLADNKTAKQRLEFDWSDKKEAQYLERFNSALDNRSNLILFKAGAATFQDHQSTPVHWENFTRNILQEAEATRQRSVALQGTLDAILTNVSRDLRCQADRVEAALTRRIACTDEIRRRLEIELQKILRKLADVEDLIGNLQTAIRRIDTPMKIAQTRLDCRSNRLRVENCRDASQFGLIEEIKIINNSMTALNEQLKEAERSQEELLIARGNLEREIMIKRKTLETDKDRTLILRSYYPTTSALSGY